MDFVQHDKITAAIWHVLGVKEVGKMFFLQYFPK